MKRICNFIMFIRMGLSVMSSWRLAEFLANKNLDYRTIREEEL